MNDLSRIEVGLQHLGFAIESSSQGKSQCVTEAGCWCSSQYQPPSPNQKDPRMVERPGAWNNQVSTKLYSLVTPPQVTLFTSFLWASVSISAKRDENYSHLKNGCVDSNDLLKTMTHYTKWKGLLWLFPVETPEFKSQVHSIFTSKALLSQKAQGAKQLASKQIIS